MRSQVSEKKIRVARSRFELLSRDPESHMIDRYTTGLLGSKMLFVNLN
jgi:hypothetical protein